MAGPPTNIQPAGDDSQTPRSGPHGPGPELTWQQKAAQVDSALSLTEWEPSQDSRQAQQHRREGPTATRGQGEPGLSHRARRPADSQGGTAMTITPFLCWTRGSPSHREIQSSWGYLQRGFSHRKGPARKRVGRPRPETPPPVPRAVRDIG